MMDKINYTEIQENLPEVMEKVCNDHQPIVITSENHPSVVLMSLADYSAYQDLSIAEVADILEVNSQHLIKLLESGELPIPFKKIGQYYRLSESDVLSFKQKMDQQRLQALQDLAEQAQELKLGYE
jgi:prevent-host-death family protein